MKNREHGYWTPDKTKKKFSEQIQRGRSCLSHWKREAKIRGRLSDDDAVNAVTDILHFAYTKEWDIHYILSAAGSDASIEIYHGISRDEDI